MFNIAARNLGLDRILVESHIPLNMDVRIHSAGVPRCVAMLMNKDEKPRPDQLDLG